jgi:hypothetical protein
VRQLDLSATAGTRSSVPTGQGETESVGETSHVESIQLPGLISAVMLDLKLRRQTRNQTIENQPLAKPIGRVSGVAAIRPGATLPAGSLHVESDGMEIHLATVG